eukprot:3720654-Pyramimonas_sp.AAC.3
MASLDRGPGLGSLKKKLTRIADGEQTLAGETKQTQQSFDILYKVVVAFTNPCICSICFTNSGSSVVDPQLRSLQLIGRQTLRATLSITVGVLKNPKANIQTHSPSDLAPAGGRSGPRGGLVRALRGS